LVSAVDEEAAWDELWQQLYHQGGIGDAAYAAVPELVRLRRERGVADWRVYALAARIELARESERNPPVPDWLSSEYKAALAELADLGVADMREASDASRLVRSILSILAIRTPARTYARFLIDFEEDELLEMEELWKRTPF